MCSLKNSMVVALSLSSSLHLEILEMLLKNSVNAFDFSSSFNLLVYGKMKQSGHFQEILSLFSAADVGIPRLTQLEWNVCLQLTHAMVRTFDSCKQGHLEISVHDIDAGSLFSTSIKSPSGESSSVFL